MTALGGPNAPAAIDLRSDPAAFHNRCKIWARATEEHAVYKFSSARRRKSAEITLYGPIGQDFFGDGISAASFKRELDSLGSFDSLDLRINSPGGSVTDAQTMYSLLVSSGAKINVMIDGFAASAASYLAMAGDTISIAEGGFFMIHEARGAGSGTAADLEQTAKVLRDVTDSIAGIYVSRTGIAKSTILDWMAEETWFDGPEAVERGFATALIPNKRADATAYGDAFENTPRELMQGESKLKNIVARADRILEGARNT